MSRFRTPLIILILGLLPFWLFIGSSNTLTINGEVVRDSRFNLAGLVMGVIGAGMAWSALRDRLNRDRLRLVLIAIAGMVCLLQIAHSVELIRIPI